MWSTIVTCWSLLKYASSALLSRPSDTAEQRPTTRWSERRVPWSGLLGWLLVIIWPWVLIAVNSNWLYLNSWTFTDTWIYFGYFHNLPDFIYVYGQHPHMYFDDRLAWILPGFAVYQVLPPLVANGLLRLSVYYGAVLGLYGTLALTINRRVATLTALLYGSYSYFILAVGSDYVEGAGLAYCSLAFLFLALDARCTHPSGWLAVAGVMVTGMVYTNLFWIVFFPCLIFYYGWLNSHRPPAAHLAAVGLLSLGGIALTLCLGAANAALGGDFFFVVSSVRFAANLAATADNPYIQTGVDWPLHSPHLVWPALTLLSIAGVFGVARLRTQIRAFPHAPLYLAMYVLASATMLVFQLRGSTPVFKLYYYTSFIYPMMGLALGTLWAPIITTLRPAAFAVAAAYTAGVAVATLTVRHCDSLQIGSIPVLLPLAGGLLWLLSMAAQLHRLLTIGLFVVVFLLVTPNPVLQVYGPGSFCRLKEQPQLDQEYLAVAKGVEAVHKIAPRTRLYFWYNLDENTVYRSLAATYLHSWNLIGEQFPSLQGPLSPEGHPPALNTYIALVTGQPSGAALAEQVLQAHNRTMHIIGQSTIQEGSMSYTITIFQVRPVLQRVVLGEQLQLSLASNAEGILRSGWNYPETFGTWTLGSRAELELILDQPSPQDVIMTVKTVAYVGGFIADRRPRIDVHVIINGVQLDTWVFDATHPAGSRQVVIPKEVMHRSDVLRIWLDIDRPYSLHELGYNDDQRPLALAVNNLSFVATR